MKTLSIRLSAVALAALLPSQVAAQRQIQPTHTQIGYMMPVINRFAMNQAPSLTLSAAKAGSVRAAATSGMTYALTSNESNRKIVAQIDSSLPAGVTLSAQLAAPRGGTSAGSVTLSATATDVVTGIGTINEAGLAITYTLNASAARAPATSRTITYTFIAGM